LHPRGHAVGPGALLRLLLGLLLLLFLLVHPAGEAGAREGGLGGAPFRPVEEGLEDEPGHVERGARGGAGADQPDQLAVPLAQTGPGERLRGPRLPEDLVLREEARERRDARKGGGRDYERTEGPPDFCINGATL